MIWYFSSWGFVPEDVHNGWWRQITGASIQRKRKNRGWKLFSREVCLIILYIQRSVSIYCSQCSSLTERRTGIIKWQCQTFASICRYILMSLDRFVDLCEHKTFTKAGNMNHQPHSIINFKIKLLWNSVWKNPMAAQNQHPIQSLLFTSLSRGTRITCLEISEMCKILLWKSEP